MGRFGDAQEGVLGIIAARSQSVCLLSVSAQGVSERISGASQASTCIARCFVCEVVVSKVSRQSGFNGKLECTGYTLRRTRTRRRMLFFVAHTSVQRPKYSMLK